MVPRYSVLSSIVFTALLSLTSVAHAYSPNPSPSPCAMTPKFKSDIVLSTQYGDNSTPRTELRIAANGSSVTFTQQYSATASKPGTINVYQADFNRRVLVQGTAARFTDVASSRLVCPSMSNEPADWYFTGSIVNTSFTFARVAAQLTGDLPVATNAAIEKAMTGMKVVFPEFGTTHAAKNGVPHSYLTVFSTGDTANPLYVLNDFKAQKMYAWNSKSGVITLVTPGKSLTYRANVTTQNSLYVASITEMSNVSQEAITIAPANAGLYVALIFRVVSEFL